MKIKRIALVAGILGILNPILGFGSMGFDLARSFSHPEIMLDVLVRPFWQYVGMPLFILTDLFGWYVLPPLLMILLVKRLFPKNKNLFFGLAILYAVVGSYGALYYAKSYLLFLETGNGAAFLEAAFFAYEVIWGTLNNFWGGVLFVSIGYLLFFHHKRKRVGSLSLATGIFMLLTSVSHMLGHTALANQILVPAYLFFFPITIISFGNEVGGRESAA